MGDEMRAPCCARAIEGMAWIGDGDLPSFVHYREGPDPGKDGGDGVGEVVGDAGAPPEAAGSSESVEGAPPSPDSAGDGGYDQVSCGI